MIFLQFDFLIISLQNNIKRSMKILSIIFLIIIDSFILTSVSLSQSQETTTMYLKKNDVRTYSYVGLSKKYEHELELIHKLGFNYALTQSGLCDLPYSKLKPLIDAANKNDVNLLFVTTLAHQFSNPSLKGLLSKDKRRYVGADGRVSPGSGCPTDTLYWETVLLHRAKFLAELEAKGNSACAGLLGDTEDYSGGFDESNYCYCKYCFGSFLKSIDDMQAKDIKPEDRYHWLSSHNLIKAYQQFQNKKTASVLRIIRRKVDKIDPNFVFALYWSHTSSTEKPGSVPWDERFGSGLSTENTPVLLFDEGTYSYGFEPSVEQWADHLKDLGENIIAVPGYNVVPSERIWWPKDVAQNAFYAAKRSGGYWIYLSSWAMLLKNSQRPRQIGGSPAEWRKAFTKLNQIIIQQKMNNPPAEFSQPISLPPTSKDLPHGYQIPDLVSMKHSSESNLFIRPWTSIGLPYKGGELVLTNDKKNSFLSFKREIKEPDRYQISAWFTFGPDRGITQLYVDNEPAGKPIDLYSPITLTSKWIVAGNVVLKKRWPRLQFKVVGKNIKSSDYEVGFTKVGVVKVGWWPQEWNVILPFNNNGEGQPGYNKVYPPEKGINIDATYKGKDGIPVHWQIVKTGQHGKLNFIPLVSDIRNEVAYALVFVKCPSNGIKSIRLGTDDGGKLWINNKFVWGENISRSATRDEDHPMAYFHKGWNKILLKITQTKAGWAFYFRIYDPMHQLKYSLKPEN